MNEIAESSARMVNLAQNLSEYENTYIQQGWGKQDVKFFDENRTRLLQTAEQLKGAAKEGDESRVVHLFNHMDSTCQSCHKRFRPDLSWS
jgi:cytochrome c556